MYTPIRISIYAQLENKEDQVNLAKSIIELARFKVFKLSELEWEELDWANTIFPTKLVNEELLDHYSFPKATFTY